METLEFLLDSLKVLANFFLSSEEWGVVIGGKIISYPIEDEMKKKLAEQERIVKKLLVEFQSLPEMIYYFHNGKFSHILTGEGGYIEGLRRNPNNRFPFTGDQDQIGESNFDGSEIRCSHCDDFDDDYVIVKVPHGFTTEGIPFFRLQCSNCGRWNGFYLNKR